MAKRHKVFHYLASCAKKRRKVPGRHRQPRKDQGLTGTIPLIRAGAIMPFLTWMRENSFPADALLQDCDLACFLTNDPDQPIPLLSLFRFACMASRTAGPDLPCRVVRPDSLSGMGYIGSVAGGAKTVREALITVMAAMPVHTTHGMISVRAVPGGMVVRDAWGMRLDEETRHYSQQYLVALIHALCDADTMGGPVFSRIAIVAHPAHGISHLRQHFGNNVFSAPDLALELHIADHVIDRPVSFAATRQSPARPLPLIPLPHGTGGLVPSARILVAGLLATGTSPTIRLLATAAGQSVRTFQRRLSEERTSFLHLVEDVRRDHALTALAAGQASAGEIASLLGYTRQSSLTRAVRRWSGTTPRHMRKGQGQGRDTP
jgi:AraC-like DNA-binding protein